MNVLLLLVDTLRSDFLGCYGNLNVKTSVLDEFAGEGVRFEQAISTATWTPPSVSALVSGIYPHRLGMFRFDKPFDEETKTLFHYFLEEGYEVGSFVFDENFLFSRVEAAHVQGNFRDFSKPLNWIKTNSHKPFFLYLHYYWVHGPYEPQSSAKAWSEANERIHSLLRDDPSGVEKCKSLYAGAVEKMSEEWLAQILETLDKKGILDETLIVFIADHGESWGERIEDKSQIKVNFDQHGRFLYDELLKVPLIMRWGKNIPSGRTIKNQVRNIDVTPTILDLCGIESFLKEKGNYRTIDGVSLRKMIYDNWKGEPLEAISSATDLEFEGIAKMSFRLPEWKLIWSLKEDTEEFYHLLDDPGEKINLVNHRSRLREEMKSKLEGELASISSKKIDEQEKNEIKKHLRGLGYL